MTDSLTVPTHFGDLSELSAGLADRVDEERIILYGPEAFEEGSMVSFAVLLVDGTPALEGVGRVAASVDGGEARAPETRYDIVFDNLQLAGRSEVVYERIVLHRQSLAGGEPPTGEVDVSELEEAGDAFTEAEEPDAAEAAEAAEAYEEVGEDLVSFATSEAPPAPEEDAGAYDMAGVPAEHVSETAAEAAFEEPAADVEDVADSEFEDVGDADDAFADYEEEAAEGATVVASIEDLERAASAPPGQPAPEPPAAPEGFALPPLPAGLTRPVHPPTWWPSDAPPPQPRASSGWFQYGGELPIPSEPPRPDLDPSLRVTPAPRPGAEATPNMPPREEASAADPVMDAEAPAEADFAEAEADFADFAEAEAEHGEAPAQDDFVDFADPVDDPAAEPLDAAAPSDAATPLDETVEAPLDEGAEAGEPDEFEVGFDAGELGDEPVAPYDEDATAHEVSLPERDPFEER